MKISFLLLMLTAIVLAAGPAATSRAQATPPPASGNPAPHHLVVPLAPAELLSLLPKTPEKWQLKESVANNSFMDWVSSQAQREFNFTPPPAESSKPGDPPPPPLVLRVTLTDTGYYQGLIGDFAESRTSGGAGTENLMLAGCPARLVMLGQTGERLRVLVKGRYVLQIDVRNQPPNAAQSWLRIVDMARLTALTEDGEEKLPRPFPMTRIDELNPRNNSVTPATWATQDEVEARGASKRR